MLKKIGIIVAGIAIAAGTTGCELLNMDDVKSAADGPVTKSDVLSLKNPLSLATSTGGTVTFSNGTVVITDGTGATVEFIPQAALTISVNGQPVGAAPVSLANSAVWCVSAPNPSTPGTFVKIALTEPAMLEAAPVGC